MRPQDTPLSVLLWGLKTLLWGLILLLWGLKVKALHCSVLIWGRKVLRPDSSSIRPHSSVLRPHSSCIMRKLTSTALGNILPLWGLQVLWGLILLLGKASRHPTVGFYTSGITGLYLRPHQKYKCYEAAMRAQDTLLQCTTMRPQDHKNQKLYELCYSAIKP